MRDPGLCIRRHKPSWNQSMLTVSQFQPNQMAENKVEPNQMAGQDCGPHMGINQYTTAEFSVSVPLFFLGSLSNAWLISSSLYHQQ